jgi:hypothetical protein
VSQVINKSAGTGLAAGPTGTIIYPDEPGWDEARAGWVVNADQQPAAVALVRSAADVSAVVASAARSRLKIIAQGTGHGAHQVGSLSRTVWCAPPVFMKSTSMPRNARCGLALVWSGER